MGTAAQIARFGESSVCPLSSPQTQSLRGRPCWGQQINTIYCLQNCEPAHWNPSWNHNGLQYVSIFQMQLQGLPMFSHGSVHGAFLQVEKALQVRKNLEKSQLIWFVCSHGYSWTRELRQWWINTQAITKNKHSDPKQIL